MPSIAFMPTPSGPLHLGSLFTYFAGWLFARKCGWDVVIVTDVGVQEWRNERDMVAWRLSMLEMLGSLGIPPDKMFPIDDLLAIWKSMNGDFMSEDTRRGLCYLCTCANHSAQMLPNDPCQDNFGIPSKETVKATPKEATWRFRLNGTKVEEHHLRLIRFYNTLGVKAFIRGRDLLDHVALHESLQQAMGMAVIPTYFVPCIITNEWHMKLSKSSNAASMEQIFAGKFGARKAAPSLILRGLWQCLQGFATAPDTLTEMVHEFRVSRITDKHSIPEMQVWINVWYAGKMLAQRQKQTELARQCAGEVEHIKNIAGHREYQFEQEQGEGVGG